MRSRWIPVNRIWPGLDPPSEREGLTWLNQVECIFVFHSLLWVRQYDNRLILEVPLLLNKLNAWYW
jgi:hypothetical protein